MNMSYTEVEVLTIYYPDHTSKTLQVGNSYFWGSPHTKISYIGISVMNNNGANVCVKFFYENNPTKIFVRKFILIGGLVSAELKGSNEN